MLRRTSLRCVHLFSALVPQSEIKGPNFLSEGQIAIAQQAIEEHADVLSGVPLLTPIASLANMETIHQQRAAIQSFGKCVDLLRSALYKKDCTDPFHRLQLHESIMAAGFYQRTINPTELKGESIRFALNHYNFDVRRDVQITKLVHDSLFEGRAATEQSEKLLEDLLMLERHLSGRYRFVLTGGRRWLTLGLPLSEVASEAEVERILDLPVIKKMGNFEFSAERELEKMWTTIKVSPKVEEKSSFFEVAGLHEALTDDSIVYTLRVQKPEKPPDFWEKLRESLLRYWVLWFALWVSFFMVDEEIITLLALIFLKYKQTKILEEEAAKTSGKVYVASALGRSRS